MIASFATLSPDEEIDILEKRVDEEGVGLLLRFQPVASDMREVISAMKVSASLERIADQSVTIARRAKHLSNRPAVREVALLEPAYGSAMVIFHDSIRAFAEGDFELAGTLKLQDRELDTLTSDLTESSPRAPLRNPNQCPATWILSSLLVPSSTSGIMQRTSLRTHFGGINAPIFATLTEDEVFPAHEQNCWSSPNNSFFDASSIQEGGN